MRNARFWLLLAPVLAIAPAAHAASTTIRHAAVEWVLAVDGEPGRCFAKLNKTVANAGNADVDCPSDSVLLACGGGADGARTFDLALFAFQSNRLVNVRVTDSAKDGDSCRATRVYVTRHRAACPSGYGERDDGDYDDDDDYNDDCYYADDDYDDDRRDDDD